MGSRRRGERGPGGTGRGAGRHGTHPAPLRERRRKPRALTGRKPGKDAAHRKLQRRRPAGKRNSRAVRPSRGRGAAEDGPEVGPPSFRLAAHRETVALSAAVLGCGSSPAPTGPETAGGGVPEPDGELRTGSGRAEAAPCPTAARCPQRRGAGSAGGTAGAGLRRCAGGDSPRAAPAPLPLRGRVGVSFSARTVLSFEPVSGCRNASYFFVRREYLALWLL